VNYNSSYNLVLPAAWISGPDIRLEAEVNPGATVPETNFNDNTLQTGNIGTRTTAPLNVGLVPVRAANLTPSLTGNTLINNMLGYLRAVFPAKTINVWYKSGGPVDADYDYHIPGDGTCGDGWDDLLDDLDDVYDDWSNRPDNAFVYGLLDSGVPPGPGHGCGRYGDPLAAGMLDKDSGPTIAHEMGHNFGRKHAPCGVPDPDGNFPTYLDPQGAPYPSASIGEVGLNVSTQKTFDPNATWDLMSYCGPEWFSPYNYTAILNRVPFAAAARATNHESLHITVSGYVSGDQLDLPRAFWVRNRAVGTYEQAGEGSYSVILRGVAGETLFERHFEPATEIIGADHDPGHFRETMPYPPETSAIAFTHEGQVLQVVPVSAHAPTVEVLSPNGGEVWDGNGSFTVHWQADDLDGDSLTFRVQYSSDGGATWESLAVNLHGDELSVMAGELAGGNNSLVRVIVSDGVNTAMDTSDAPFTVSDKPPLAWIIQPGDGAVLYPDQPVILQGTATDAEDGPLPGERLTWVAETGETLGEGVYLALPNLPAGTHRFTLKAEDSAGHVTETSVTLIIGAGGCAGDCDGNGSIDASDLVRGVNISLGTAPVTTCPSFDRDGGGTVTVDELTWAVNSALIGCPAAGASR